MPPTHMLNAKALYTTISIKKTLTLLICDHPGVLGACTVHSTFLILSRAPVNRCLPSVVGPITRAGTPLGPSSEHEGFSSCGLRDLKVASRTSRTALLALQVSAEQSVGWMTAMPSSTNPAYCTQIGPKL